MNPDQQLGALIARVDALEKMDERIDGKLTVLQEDISEIKVTLAHASGSWRALVAMGSIIAAVAGAAGAWVHAWFGKP